MATLLRQLTLATQPPQEAERASPVTSPTVEDADQDGVPDATEAFLGTSTQTDETLVGQGDDGFVRDPRREPTSTSALMRDVSCGPRSHQDSPPYLRLAVLSRT